jgi:hypothetical protein
MEEELDTKTSMVQSLVDSFKENPVAYMLGLLVLQQLGYLGEAASKLQGVCF